MSTQPNRPARTEVGDLRRQQDVTLLDLVDRILDKGVILSGDVTLSVAGVDLVYLSLRALLTSVETASRLQTQAQQQASLRRGTTEP